MFFFFFSSRRRHTRCYRDWSSDVCSSDLLRCGSWCRTPGTGSRSARCCCSPRSGSQRSEERRVGKECRSLWSPDHEKKKVENGLQLMVAPGNSIPHNDNVRVRIKI